MVSRRAFTAFVLLLGLQRLLEIRLSRRNERIIRARGGREYAPQQLQWMKALHAAWLAAMPLEVYVLERPFRPALAIPAAMMFGAGQALRYAAIHTLGWRWTVRVMTMPGTVPIQSGIYSRLRHPNYLGVALEIAAAPLLHGAYWTSILFSGLNGILLVKRIQVEEQALEDVGRNLEEFDEPEVNPIIPAAMSQRVSIFE